MKFGLELLARVQHRPLSQAAEWAIKLALRSTRAGSAKAPTLFDLLESIERETTEGEKIWTLSVWNRQLLSFEERAVIHFIENSPGAMSNPREEGMVDTHPDSGEEVWVTRIVPPAPVWENILPNWERIKAFAIRRANEGLPGRTPPLRDIVESTMPVDELPLGLDGDDDQVSSAVA